MFIVNIDTKLYHTHYLSKMYYSFTKFEQSLIINVISNEANVKSA